MDGVSRGTAAQCVVEIGARQHFDARKHIAGGIARRTGGAIERDGDAAAGMAVIGRVYTRSADQGVGTRAADQHVITAAAIEHVAATAGHQGIVARAAAQGIRARSPGDAVIKAGADHTFDIEQLVTFGIAAVPGRAVEADGDCAQGSRIIDRVDAVAAIDAIGACTADQRIVAGIAIERIVAGAAGDLVIAVAAMDGCGVGACPQSIVIGRSGQVFDADQHIACGIAAGRLAAIEANRDRRART